MENGNRKEKREKRKEEWKMEIESGKLKGNKRASWEKKRSPFSLCSCGARRQRREEKRREEKRELVET